MAVLKIYPASVLAGQSFTTAQLANVLGNNTNYAVHTDAIAVNGGYGGTFKFPFSSLPANIGSITSIVATVVAKASLANSRQAYSVECYNGSTILFKTQSSTTPGRLGTADTTATVSSALATGPFDTNVALWRNDNIEVNFTFIGIANGTTSITTSWKTFSLDITYDLLPSAGPDSLFLGANF